MIQSIESIYEDAASTDSEDFIIRESKKQDIQGPYTSGYSHLRRFLK